MSEEPIKFSPEFDGYVVKEKMEPNPKVSSTKYIVFFLITIFITSLTVRSVINSLNQPPVDFPLYEPVVIESGIGVRAITEILSEKNVVKSDTLLYYVLVLFYDPTNIKASAYIFDHPLTTIEVAKRLNEGDFDTDLIRFTHFEGERASKLAKRAAEVLPQFNTERFLTATQSLEGRLFPETYFIPVSYTDEDLLKLLTQTFDARTASLQDKINQHKLSLDEILILASIIEREANSVESKKMVSGILQNRLEINMSLQADASIEYILDKPLSELTPEDLEIDSPYNTYLYGGLPPTPIGNPGLDAMEAVLDPTPSDYFYYVTDDEGVFHYAKTYDEHLLNIERYLR
jgi:UPF0755 protein